MIYLNKKQFLPAMILISTMFLPMILTITILSIYDHSFQPLLIAGILLFIYLFLLFCFFKIAQSKKNYLVFNDNGLEICCGSKYCDKNTGIWKISYSEIERIEYYKMSSLKGWFSLWYGLFPRCVFLTIRDCFGKEDSIFIGYLNLDQVTMLSQIGGIDLLIH